MKKYLAGGKAMSGSGNSCGGGSPAVASQQNASLAAMLAARDAQDAMWKQPVAQEQNQMQIVTVEQKKPSQTKAVDIDMILNGDY